jgi:hypothetical protein
MRWTKPRRWLVGIFRKASRNCDGLWKRVPLFLTRFYPDTPSFRHNRLWIVAEAT